MDQEVELQIFDNWSVILQSVDKWILDDFTTVLPKRSRHTVLPFDLCVYTSLVALLNTGFFFTLFHYYLKLVFTLFYIPLITLDMSSRRMGVRRRSLQELFNTKDSVNPVRTFTGFFQQKTSQPQPVVVDCFKVTRQAVFFALSVGLFR